MTQPLPSPFPLLLHTLLPLPFLRGSGDINARENFGIKDACR